MLLFYQISAWVFLIHMFLYAGFYCSITTLMSSENRPDINVNTNKLSTRINLLLLPKFVFT